MIMISTLRRLSTALLAAAALTLVFGTATALGGSGAGDVFNLGQTNSVDQTSTLTGFTTGPQLLVQNNNDVGIRSESRNTYGVYGLHNSLSGTRPGVAGYTISTDAAASGVLGSNSGGGPGLKALVNAGAPPIAVNSKGLVVNLNADFLDGLTSAELWNVKGNAGTKPGNNFLGTTDNQPLEFKVDAQRALRLEPEFDTSNLFAPNLIGGASTNVVAGGAGATIGGGESNRIEQAPNEALPVQDGTIAGGYDNRARNDYSTVGGGSTNTADGQFAAVAGGGGNTAVADQAAVGGGFGNGASAFAATVGGGRDNAAGGSYSAIPGGYQNSASGSYSFAAGRQAKANSTGAFVWGDSTAADVAAPAANTFSVRASGGIWLGKTSSPSVPAGRFVNTSTGAYLSNAGAWTNNSDRALKHDFRPLNGRSVLRRIGRLPIGSWSYKAEKPSVRHVGPTAQDFYKAFGLGLDDRHITTIDEGGVALAAIQGLYRQNLALQKRVARLERTVVRLSRR